LLSRIRERFYRREVGFNEEVLITSERHRTLLAAADEALSRVEESLKAGLPEDFFTIDLADAYTALGNITGENADEALIDEIFSKFCMGK
jgi:tRNA modification GTPase